MGVRVGDFQVVRAVGRGGTAGVHLGRRLSDGAAVAMKIVPAARAGTLRREATLAAAIDHSHIPAVLDVVSDGEWAALVTEFLPGGSLAGLLRRRGRLSPGETLTVLLPLAAVLAVAHERELVHGDVSTGNVLFDAAGRPLLADLGAARAAADMGGPVALTPADVAPEVARGAPPTPAADLFGLGSVALACLTGRSAWPAQTVREVIAAAAGDRWPDPGNCPAAPVLAAAVRSLLAAEPARRPGAAALFLQLRAAPVSRSRSTWPCHQAGSGGSSPGPRPPRPTPPQLPSGPPGPPPPRPPGRRRRGVRSAVGTGIRRSSAIWPRFTGRRR